MPVRRITQTRFSSRAAKELFPGERSFAVPRDVAVSNPSRSSALTLPGLTPNSRASL